MAPRGSGFRLDPDFEKRLTSSPLVGEIMQPRTAAVAEQAKRNTRYRGIARGMFAVVGIGPGGRMVGRVGSDDMKTGWAEFGTSKIAQERALGRALESVVGPIQSQGGRGA